MEVLANIPVQLDAAKLMQQLHIGETDDDAGPFRAFLADVVPIVNAKAVYDVVFIDHKGEDTVTLGGVTFTSRVLRMNLDAAERVFPYIATCGHELDEIEFDRSDFVRSFWLDAMKGAALGQCIRHLNEYLNRRYALGKTSSMNPGSADRHIWPIEQQKELFALFGDVECLIGVRLTETFLMIPNKSVSGLRYSTEIDFNSCQVCKRDVCPSRRAPFDAALAGSYEHPE